MAVWIGDKRALTTKEAGEILGVPMEYVRKMVKEKKLSVAYRELSGRIMVWEEEVNKLLVEIRAKMGISPQVEIKRETQKEFLTVGETAEMIGIHPNTLRRWDGLLPPHRIGPRRDRRYLLEDIKRFIEHSKRGR